MTHEERIALRQAYQDAGFERVYFSHALADAERYTEVWSDGENVATIAWGPKTRGEQLDEAVHGVVDAYNVQLKVYATGEVFAQFTDKRLKGCMTEGDAIDHALEMLADAYREFVAAKDA